MRRVIGMDIHRTFGEVVIFPRFGGHAGLSGHALLGLLGG